MRKPRPTIPLPLVTFENDDVAIVRFCRTTDTKVWEGVFVEAPLGKAGKASASSGRND